MTIKVLMSATFLLLALLSSKASNVQFFWLIEVLSAVTRDIIIILGTRRRITFKVTIDNNKVSIGELNFSFQISLF